MSAVAKSTTVFQSSVGSSDSETRRKPMSAVAIVDIHILLPEGGEYISILLVEGRETIAAMRN